MRKSIATVSVSGSLTEKLDAIASAKFAAIELFDADLTCSPLSPEDVARRCDDLGLGIDLFQPLRDCVGLLPEAFSDRLRFARAKLEMMERLGATRALLCSAVHPAAVDDLDLAAEQLAAVGAGAADHGVSLAFEALAWGTCISRTSQAWSVVEAADTPNVGLAVDTFHLLSRGDDASVLSGVPGERIEFLQIADAPHLSMDVLEWSRHHRCFPGQGTLDVVGVVAAVLEAGYRGPLSLEVFSDIVREAPPRETARDAMRSLLYLEEQLRRYWDSRQNAVPLRPSVELFDPPAPPSAVDVVAVRVAVTPGDQVVPDLLSGLGFRTDDGAGPVTAWRSGNATVLVDRRSDLELRRPSAVARPTVHRLGFAVDDPARLAARAEALGWHPVAGSGADGSRGVPTTQTPVGIEVAVIEQADEEPDEDGGLDGIDHVGAVVDLDRSDAEVSFYRTLFGFEPGPVSEFMDPAGRLRSRVLRPPSGGTTVVHNIAERSHDRVPLGVNQVAFRCTGLLDRVEQMRAHGVPLLDVPDGYYDDLRARLDPDPALLARIRRLGVLYDRDADGELLHVYTPLVGGRFYVEVLERLGGYAGFGAANTPVRLAAQAATAWL